MNGRDRSLVRDLVGMLVGGAARATAGGLLVRAGVRPRDAALAVASAGAAGLLVARGFARAMSGGAAAAGVGQLALAWLERENAIAHVEEQRRRDAVHAERLDLGQQPGAGIVERGSGAAWEGADIEAAFDRAREQLDMEDEAAALAEETEAVLAAERNPVPVDPEMPDELVRRVLMAFRVGGKEQPAPAAAGRS